MTAVWQTAVQYHAWHALALFGLGLLMLHWPERLGLGLAGWLFVAGIVLFSGSLYALALTGVRGLGAVTPIGGVAFLAAWAVLAWAIATRVAATRGLGRRAHSTFAPDSFTTFCHLVVSVAM